MNQIQFEFEPQNGYFESQVRVRSMKQSIPSLMYAIAALARQHGAPIDEPDLCKKVEAAARGNPSITKENEPNAENYLAFSFPSREKLELYEKGARSLILQKRSRAPTRAEFVRRTTTEAIEP
jgi:hypothetical protein